MYNLKTFLESELWIGFAISLYYLSEEGRFKYDNFTWKCLTYSESLKQLRLACVCFVIIVLKNTFWCTFPTETLMTTRSIYSKTDIQLDTCHVNVHDIMYYFHLFFFCYFYTLNGYYIFFLKISKISKIK